MKFSSLPQYELGERYSKDRTSSKYKRAARRLRKKGYKSEAGRMALQAELERMNEPTIMRPEHRELEAKQQERLVQSRVPQIPTSTSAIDPSQGMADLRGNFFGDIAASNLPVSEQAMFAKRFDSQVSDMAKQQKAYVDLQNAQRKNREDQRIAQLTPQVATRVREIMESKGTDSQKQKALTKTMLSPQVSTALSNTSVSSIFTSAADQLKINKADRSKIDTLVKERVGKGDLSLIDQASPEMSDMYRAIGMRESSKETRTEQLKELEDIEGMLNSLRRGNLEDNALQSLIQAQGIPETANNKEILVELILLLTYNQDSEEERNRLSEMSEADLYIEAYKDLFSQKGALSMRGQQQQAAVNPAASAAASSWST